MSAGRKVNTQSKHWGTPLKYVEAVKKVFGGNIGLDPCSNEYSIVGVDIEIMLPQDGLKKIWDSKTIFVNPPYGKDGKTSIKDWIIKCEDTYKKNECQILALIPVATNTAHWKKHIFKSATGICFLSDTRLKFLVDGKEEGKGAPMACAMVYWGKYYSNFDMVFMEHGFTIKLR